MKALCDIQINIIVQSWELNYGFCNKSFRKDEPLTSWTLFSTYLSSKLDSPLIKTLERIRFSSNQNISTCYKIHTLGRKAFSVLFLLYFWNFTSFLVKDSSIIFNREDVIGLWNKSWYLCCTTSLIVVPPLLSFFKGVIILSIKPEVPSSKYLPSLIPAINFVICMQLVTYSEKILIPFLI